MEWCQEHKKKPFLESAQIDSGTWPISYWVGVGDAFRRGKAAGGITLAAVKQGWSKRAASTPVIQLHDEHRANSAFNAKAA